jgi:DNA-binding CsgD family transcriptional regulator
VLNQLPETAATLEARAALSFAQGRLVSARGQLLASIDRADADGVVEAGARVRLGLAYVDCVLALGREAAEASRRVVEQHDDLTGPTALAFLALARALQDGARAGLDQLADLPVDTAEISPHEITALVVRGQLRGLTGDLDGAIADLSAGVRRRGAVIGRVLGLGAYVHLTWAQYFAGSWEAAHRTLDVVRETSSDGARQFDRPILHSLSAILAAGEGDGATARKDVDRAEQLATAADFDGPMLHVSLARAAIAQALGHPAEVIEHLAGLRPPRIEVDRYRLNAVLWLPALVDARVAVGDQDAAASDLAELVELTGAGAGGPDDGGLAVPLAWARGRVLEGRGRSDAALAAFELGLSAGCPQGEPMWYRAHVRAARGRLLVATGRGTDGVADLRRAEQSFRALGASAFADRCARELAHTTPLGPVVPDQLGELTPRERETADLVARGWTNKEIAAHQFVSPKTVEYHLRNTYIKLAITSRRELRDLLQARSPLVPEPALPPR